MTIKRKLLSLFVTISIILSLFSINNVVFSEAPGSDSRIVPTETIFIFISQTSASLKRGEGVLLTASISDVDPNATVGWTSSDETVATVSDNGYVIGCSAGTAVITAIYDGATGMLGVKTARCQVTVSSDLILENGTYFLKNKQTGRYADIKGPTMALGTTIHQWQFHGGNSQEWVFDYLGDGYYSIRSNNSSSPYYLGVKNDSTGLDVDIVLRTGTITDGMKWRIELTQNGAYKIIPKTGEASGYVLATSTSNTTNGAKLIQGDYIDNNSYRDEWIIEPYSIMFYGVTNSGHDHITCLNTISDTMYNRAWTNITVRSGAINASTCKNDLTSNDIFASRSHGFLVTYSGTAGVASTGILLNDTNIESNMIVFFSHSWSNMSSGSMSISSNDDYSRMNVALFIGCRTGAGGEGGRNLPSTIVQRGAKAAIGFSESILCYDANTWTLNFFTKMLQGATLQEAVNYACGLASEESGLKSVVKCGDMSIRIS